MAVNTKDYDPLNVVITLDSHIVSGFADGTYITVTRNNQTWNTVAGASGEHARAKSNDRTGTVEITLMQTSITNDWLSNKLYADEMKGNTGKFKLSIIDGNGPLDDTNVLGQTTINALEAWVQQAPSVEFGKELSDRVWTIEAGDLEFIRVGGTS